MSAKKIFKLTLKSDAPIAEIAAAGANGPDGVYRQHFVNKSGLELSLTAPELERVKLSLRRKQALDLVTIEEVSPVAA